MRNMVLQLIISQMVRNVSYSKTLSMVLMNFVRSRILLTIWEQHPTLLIYNEYVTLLLSAASAFDHQFKPKRTKRHFLLHDIQDCYDTTYDIDYPVSSIQAHATNF
jgi:hypothetical protein